MAAFEDAHKTKWRRFLFPSGVVEISCKEANGRIDEELLFDFDDSRAIVRVTNRENLMSIRDFMSLDEAMPNERSKGTKFIRIGRERLLKLGELFETNLYNSKPIDYSKLTYVVRSSIDLVALIQESPAISIDGVVYSCVTRGTVAEFGLGPKIEAKAFKARAQKLKKIKKEEPDAMNQLDDGQLAAIVDNDEVKEKEELVEDPVSMFRPFAVKAEAVDHGGQENAEKRACSMFGPFLVKEERKGADDDKEERKSADDDKPQQENNVEKVEEAQKLGKIEVGNGKKKKGDEKGTDGDRSKANDPKKEGEKKEGEKTEGEKTEEGPPSMFRPFAVKAEEVDGDDDKRKEEKRTNKSMFGPFLVKAEKKDQREERKNVFERDKTAELKMEELRHEKKKKCDEKKDDQKPKQEGDDDRKKTKKDKKEDMKKVDGNEEEKEPATKSMYRPFLVKEEPENNSN